MDKIEEKTLQKGKNVFPLWTVKFPNIASALTLCCKEEYNSTK